MLALPKQYERERRFVNLYRQHDSLRGMTDEEFERFVHYVESSTHLVLDVMDKEKAANTPRRPRTKKSAAVTRGAPKAGPKTAPKRAPARKRKAAPKQQ